MLTMSKCKAELYNGPPRFSLKDMQSISPTEWYNRVYVQPKLKPPPSPEPLIRLIRVRKWTETAIDSLMISINEMRQDVKFIDHLPSCRMCLIEIEIDVERYMGRRSFWWVDLQGSEYLEARYRKCPKERNYHIGNYWEQVQYYREHGTCDVPGENTEQFILDRAKWAHKIYGKQIHVVRQLLKMLRSWNFNTDPQKQLDEFNRIYTRLGMYDVALSFEL